MVKKESALGRNVSVVKAIEGDLNERKLVDGRVVDGTSCKRRRLVKTDFLYSYQRATFTFGLATLRSGSGQRGFSMADTGLVESIHIFR